MGNFLSEIFKNRADSLVAKGKKEECDKMVYVVSGLRECW